MGLDSKARCYSNRGRRRRNTLYDQELRSFFQKNFALAYVDTEGYQEPPSYPLGERTLSQAELLDEFRGRPTPSWVFITPDGVRLHGDRGGRTLVRELMRDGGIAIEKLKAAGGS